MATDKTAHENQFPSTKKCKGLSPGRNAKIIKRKKSADIPRANHAELNSTNLTKLASTIKKLAKIKETKSITNLFSPRIPLLTKIEYRTIKTNKNEKIGIKYISAGTGLITITN